MYIHNLISFSLYGFVISELNNHRQILFNLGQLGDSIVALFCSLHDYPIFSLYLHIKKTIHVWHFSYIKYKILFRSWIRCVMFTILLIELLFINLSLLELRT